MNLTAAELRQLLYCCAEELRARARGKPPGVQPWLVGLVRRLELEAACRDGDTDSGCGEQAGDYDDDKRLGSRQVAAILRWEMRKVQRRAADLSGCRVSGKLVFRESVVREYAEVLTHGHIG